MLSPLLCFAVLAPGNVTVRSMEEFRAAVRRARAGDEIVIAPGRYAGGGQFANLRGEAGRPIRIRAAEAKNAPVFTAGLQFSDVAYLEIDGLTIQGARDNGLNIDDGGTLETPSHHVTLRNLRISDLPAGNHDGIKLSGVEEFRVEGCTVERWGGSGIDMVGCHRGRIEGCCFLKGGDSGVQAKGGSSDVAIVRCRFEDFGERGVNIGGSTGMPFFRPPVAKMPAGGRYEAKNISVLGNTFRGGSAAVAFVGVDGAAVRFNTIAYPGPWALRILQETREAGFVPSRNGVFSDNLIVFRSVNWRSGGVNVGDGTEPGSFRFQRNFWFCADAPQRSRPMPPTPETGGVYGVDPGLTEALGVAASSPARGYGAHAWKE